MNTQTASGFDYRLLSSVSRGPKISTHSLLKAFERSEYGHLTLITPEGRTMQFGGGKPGPDAQMRIYNWHALDALMARGDIGFAEAYMDREWDSDDLAALLTFGLVNRAALEKYFHGRPWHALWLRLRNVFNGNTLSGSRRNIRTHYDLGNDFYRLWLDDSMTYSGALFEGDATRTLEQAQQAKYNRILRKLNAKSGERILEIGCGWGGFAEAAAKQGLHVTGVTLSQEQADYARKRLQEAAGYADIRLTDYRDVDGTFDHVVSIGMFEHVGREYWDTYFNTIKRHLEPGGRAMIQSIVLDDDIFERVGNDTGFIEHYIFPGGFLPSRRRFVEAAEKAGLVCNETFTFGRDYARTLGCWQERFDSRTREVKALGFDETFIRMWRFYLALCAATFVSGRSNLMQAELTHPA